MIASAVPLQTTTPDPFLPLARTTLDNGDGSAGFADDVMTGKAPGRIQTPEEWYRCRKPELRKYSLPRYLSFIPSR